MFNGKHFVPHMGISRTKYEYQKVNRIEARTSTDHRKDRSYIRDWSFKGMPAAQIVAIGIDFVAKSSDREIVIAVRTKL